MTRRRKKQIGKELAAIASLRDSDIDTSDIPEITDWSQAVVGRFYRSAKITTSGLGSLDAAFTPRPLPNPTVELNESARTAFAEMTPKQLVLECVQGGTEAWQEFIRRWNSLIAGVVLRTARRWGKISPELIEDLLQETYLKLCANDSQVLRSSMPSHENAFIGYLKIVAANVVNDYFRTAHATKRARGSTSNELEPELLALESSSVVANMENAVFIEEIDRALKAIASERDRAIFRLYFFRGLSSKEIASIPEFQLTVKGLESAILRLMKLVRHELTQTAPARQSQQGAFALKKKDH